MINARHALLWGEDPRDPYRPLQRMHDAIAEIRRERRRVQYARENLLIADARRILTQRMQAVEANDRYGDEPLIGGE